MLLVVVERMVVVVLEDGGAEDVLVVELEDVVGARVVDVVDELGEEVVEATDAAAGLVVAVDADPPSPPPHPRRNAPIRHTMAPRVSRVPRTLVSPIWVRLSTP